MRATSVLALLAMLATQSSARLVQHDLHRAGNSLSLLDASRPPKYCEEPVKKAKVVLPEKLQGRSKYYQTHTMYSG